MMAPSANNLIWPGKNISFLSGPPLRHLDLRFGGVQRPFEADAVDDAAAVGDKEV